MTHITSKEDAFLHLIESTLATVEELAAKKSAPRNEFLRQCTMAQAAIYWVKSYKSNRLIEAFPRVVAVIENKCSVKSWLSNQWPEAKHLDVLEG